MFSPHKSTHCRLAPQVNLAVLGCSKLGFSRHIALSLVLLCTWQRPLSAASHVPERRAPSRAEGQQELGWTGSIQTFPCFQRLLVAHSTWCQQKVLAWRSRSREPWIHGSPFQRNGLCFRAHQDLHCGTTCTAPSFKNTGRPDRSLPHAGLTCVLLSQEDPDRFGNIRMSSASPGSCASRSQPRR